MGHFRLTMDVRVAIFGAVLAALIFLSACKSYRQEQKADEEEKAAAVARMEASGELEPGKIQVLQPKERVVQHPEPTPTPTPTPETLLNRPLDPAGAPPK